MGLDDRDYMRNRHRGNVDRVLGDRRSPFTPPRQGASYLVIAAWWLLIAMALYAAVGWWQQKQHTEKLARQNAMLLKQQAERAPPMQHPCRTPCRTPCRKPRGKPRRLATLPRSRSVPNTSPRRPREEPSTCASNRTAACSGRRRHAPGTARRSRG